MIRSATLVLLFVGFVIQASSAHDLPVREEFWSVLYGRKLVLSGRINSQPEKVEIKIKPESADDLTISFVYDSGQPGTCKLAIREGKEILKEIEADPVMGAYFTVPVKELISLHQQDSRFELDFLYTDDRGKNNLKLGTLVFIVQ